MEQNGKGLVLLSDSSFLSKWTHNTHWQTLFIFPTYSFNISVILSCFFPSPLSLNVSILLRKSKQKKIFEILNWGQTSLSLGFSKQIRPWYKDVVQVVYLGKHLQRSEEVRQAREESKERVCYPTSNQPGSTEALRIGVTCFRVISMFPDTNHIKVARLFIYEVLLIIVKWLLGRGGYLLPPLACGWSISR